jgi:exopolysaccharide biosynthesis polyprenyl glycosylphosphotransferase
METPSVTAIVEASLRPLTYPSASSKSRKLQWSLLTISLIFSDALMIAIAFQSAYFVRFETSIAIFHLEVTPSISHYRQLILILIPVWLLLFIVSGLYQRQNLLGGTQEYKQIFHATTIGLVLVIAFGFLVTDLVLARGWLLLAWMFVFLFTSASRFLIRRVVYSLRRHGYFLSSAIIVGSNDEGTMLADQLLSWKTSGLHVLGFVDSDIPEGTPVLHHLNCLGGIHQLGQIIRQFGVEEIILATSSMTRAEMVAIFKEYGVSSNVNVRLSSGLFEIITTGVQLSEIASVPLVRVNKVRLTGWDRIFKLVLDYSLTIPGIILFSPLMLLIAILIKLDSPGPVLHKRRVMGVNGTQFNAYKFRSMYANGNEILENYPELKRKLMEDHKLVDDPRITRIGKLLRKTSLDELPQLFNVLKREMSLVGPRMITPAEMAKYDRWDLNLLTVHPGITGLWQVSGRSDISYEERVLLDMHYIRNWSIWLDLQLVLMTIPAVIKGRGAY